MGQEMAGGEIWPRSDGKLEKVNHLSDANVVLKRSYFCSPFQIL